MEAPALHIGERVADQLLDVGQRGAELVEIALDERRQQRRQHELRDRRRSLGRRHEPLERLPPRPLPTAPARPSGRRARPATPPASGGAPAAAPGAPRRAAPRPRPPGRPSANVHMPTAERAARPAAWASPGASTSRPSSAASAWATASASLVPEPSPTCGGIASTTRRCAPPASPSASRQRCANASARSASAPSADSSSAGRASSTTAGRLTDTPEPAEAARAVAGDREHAQVQARGRLDAHRAHGSPTTARTWRVTYSIASRSRGPAVLSTSTCSRRSSARDLLRREHARARGEDRRLEHRVARAVQAQELAAGAAVDHHACRRGRAARRRRSPRRAPRATSRRRPAPRPRRWPPDGSAGAGRRAPPG